MPILIMNYFSDELSRAVFMHQVNNSNDQLDNHFVQLYFEEAHNLFPSTEILLRFIAV